MLSFAVDAAVFGLASAFPFKLVNLLIHCLNAFLTYLCARKLFELSPAFSALRRGEWQTWAALLAAAFFLLHPLQLTAVLLTVQRMALLACSFQLLALLVFLVHRERWLTRTPSTGSMVNLAAAIGALSVLGGFAKENALLTPWLILVVEAFFFRYVCGGEVLSRLRVLSWFLWLAPLMGAVVYLGFVNPDFLPRLYAERSFGVEERLLTQARILWIYLYWLVFPGACATGLHHDDLAVARSLWEPLTLAAVLGWAAVCALIVPAWSRRWAVIAFAFAWYLVAQSMESSAFPLEMVYEHRNYSSIFGFLLLAATGVARLAAAYGERVAALATVVVLGLLVLLLSMRAAVWSDELNLATQQLAEHPNSLRSRYHYANVNLRIADQSPDFEIARKAVVQADYYYASMLEIDAEDLVALVSRVYIDARYFQGHDHARRFAAFVNALAKETLTPTDYNALGFFAQCSVQRNCARDRHEYEEVMSRLAQRPELASYMLMFRAEYLARVERDSAGALRLLDNLLLADPDFSDAYPRAIELYAAERNFPAVMSLLVRVYENAYLHSQLRVLRNYFDPPDRLP